MLFNNSTNVLVNDSLLINTVIKIPSRFGTIVGAVTAFVFCFFGVISNLLILAAILRTSTIRKNLVNQFIVSLQINDLWNLCFNQLQVGLAYTFQGWLTSWSCDIFVYSSIICTGSLLWHHALISIHRYLVVVRKRKNSFCGMSPSCYMTVSLILARLIPTIVCMPAFLHGQMTQYSPIALRCLLAPSISGFQNLLIVIFNMFLPCTIVVYCFIRIYRCVSRGNIRRKLSSISNHSTIAKNNSSEKKRSILQLNESQNLSKGHDAPLVNRIHRQTSTTNKQIRKEMRREIQLSRMFGTIFLVFLFGFLPYGIIRGSDKDNSLHPDVYVALSIIFIISIGISPLIYGLMNNQIRTQCKILIRLIFGISKPDKKEQFTFTVKRDLSHMSHFSSNAHTPKLSHVSSFVQLRSDLSQNNIQIPRKCSS